MDGKGTLSVSILAIAKPIVLRQSAGVPEKSYPFPMYPAALISDLLNPETNPRNGFCHMFPTAFEIVLCQV